MSTETTERKKLGFIQGMALLLLPLLTYALAPRHPLSELDPDEGINLIKALLLSQNYQMYSELWSDQPPLLASLLAQWGNLLGHTPEISRLLILLFTALLLWGLFSLIIRTRALLTAALTVPLLYATEGFLRASSAVMVGLPSISLSVLALYFGSRFSCSAKRRHLFLSALLFASACLCKLLAVLVLPALIYEICRNADKPVQFRDCLRKTTLFGLLFVFCLLGLALLAAPDIFFYWQQQLISPHRSAHSLLGKETVSPFLTILLHEKPVFLLAAAGLFLCSLSKRSDIITPALWLLCSLVFAIFHRPLWWHHSLMISVPLVWMAVLGIAETLLEGRRILRKRSYSSIKSLFALCVLAGLLLYASTLPDRYKGLYERAKLSSRALEAPLIGAMKKYKSETNWVVTDRPFYAYVLGKPVPPEIAVFSSKRLGTGLLTEKKLLAVIEQYKPEQIVLSRFPEIKRWLEPRLKENYITLVQAGESSLYLRSDLIQ